MNLPILLVVIFLSNPTSNKMFGGIPIILFFLLYLGLVYGFWKQQPWLMASTAVLLSAHYFFKIHVIAINSDSNRILASNEEVLCAAWKDGDIGIADLSNGKQYLPNPQIVVQERLERLQNVPAGD